MSAAPMPESSWLIQRLDPPTGFANPFSFGGGLVNGGLSSDAMKLLRGVFDFDYMGAAEFEFGAVPEALNRIARCSTLEAFEMDELPVFVIAPAEWHDEVKQRIKAFGSDRPPRTKERVGLHDALNPRDDWPTRTRGWLELDNGFFFFVDREMWAATASLFGVIVRAEAAS